MFYSHSLAYLQINLGGQISNENSRPEFMVMALWEPDARLWPVAHPPSFPASALLFNMGACKHIHELPSSHWSLFYTPTEITSSMLSCCLYPVINPWDNKTWEEMVLQTQEVKWAQSSLARVLRVERSSPERRESPRWCPGCPTGPAKSWPPWGGAKLKQSGALWRMQSSFCPCIRGFIPAQTCTQFWEEQISEVKNEKRQNM